MTVLILGLVLWTLAHAFKRIAPGEREVLQRRLGNASKGIIAVLLLLSVVLMVIGYKRADGAALWDATAATRGINNLMMLAAVALFGLGNSKSRLREKLRHPMLWGAVVWAAAHLLVNGDVPSLVLFGGIALWSLLEIALINRAVRDYKPWTGGTVAGDIRLAVISVVVFAVVAGVHTWLGHPPFGG